MASFSAGSSERAQDTTDRRSVGRPSNRLSSSLLDTGDNTVADIWRDGEVDEARLEQLQGLRQLCIPMLCLLQHSVLHTTGCYRECLALADMIASEQYQLYKVFNRAELQQLLGKIRDSSLHLLDQDLDPLGYEISS